VSLATSKSASSGRPSGLNTRYVTRTDTQCNDEPYKADSEGAVDADSGQLCKRQASDKVRKGRG